MDAYPNIILLQEVQDAFVEFESHPLGLRERFEGWHITTTIEGFQTGQNRPRERSRV
jgi:hypothetical protein